MSRFAKQLQRFNLSGRTATFRTSISLKSDDDGMPIPLVLELRPAGDSNKPWAAAVAKWTAKQGGAARLAQRQDDADKLALERDRKLFPGLVVVGWTGAFDADGTPLPFNAKDCAELLEELPEWAMQQLRLFAYTPVHFLGDDDATPAEIEATAGN